MPSDPPSSRLRLAERIEGSLLGLLVGDALGVPYEFSPAVLLPPLDQLEMNPPSDFERSHKSVPPGTWSDDGAQALCLLASLLSQRGLELEDFSARLLGWHDRGAYAVDGVVFDCGIQTSVALEALRSGAAPESSGPSDEQSNGNGSLMRVLPLALWHTEDDAHLVRDAMRQSLPTHGHLRSQLCCALYCLWIRRELTGSKSAWTEAVASLRALLADNEHALHELSGPIGVDKEPHPTGSGYVVDCLHSARFSLRERTFDAALKRAVSLGRDTDTTAAVTGGLAGARFGASKIPPRWRRELRGQDLLRPLLTQLLERRDPGR